MLSIFTDLGMTQILLDQCYNLQNIFLHQVNSHLDFFSSNWVVFARSGRKFLARISNARQERFF